MGKSTISMENHHFLMGKSTGPWLPVRELLVKLPEGRNDLTQLTSEHFALPYAEDGFSWSRQGGCILKSLGTADDQLQTQPSNHKFEVKSQNSVGPGTFQGLAMNAVLVGPPLACPAGQSVSFQAGLTMRAASPVMAPRWFLVPPFPGGPQRRKLLRLCLLTAGHLPSLDHWRGGDDMLSIAEVDSHGFLRFVQWSK